MDGERKGRMKHWTTASTINYLSLLSGYIRLFHSAWLSPALEYIWLTRFWLLGRLYSKGRILGHKRAKRNTRPNTSLLQIEGVATKEDAQFYLGKVR